MAGRPAARITDMHVCPMVTPGLPPIPHVGGPIIPTCSPNVITGGMNQARVTDLCTCVGPVDQIVQGSPTVLVNGLQAARIGDTTVHGGVITTGFPTVLIGESGTGGSPNIASMSLMDKMLAAIESANLPAAILQQLGDLRVLVGSTIAITGLLVAAAAIGVGTGGLAAGLLLAGAFLSGMQIGNGLMALVDFVEICQTAQTTDDLKRAGNRFSDGIAEIGVGGVSLLLSMEGANQLASAQREVAIAQNVEKMSPEWQAEYAEAEAAGWRRADGSIWYPPNNGAAGEIENVGLDVGQSADRYGNDGSFMGAGDSAESRALPFAPSGPPNQYVVAQRLQVEKSTVAPWFGQPGGGVQYRLVPPDGGPGVFTVQDALDLGYLKKAP